MRIECIRTCGGRLGIRRKNETPRLHLSLLLVHGWPQTWYALRLVMPALARDIQVIAVDHDTGMWIGYALAADHPERIDRLAVAETPIPGLSPSPPLLSNAHLNDRRFHFGFNWLGELNEQLVTGCEDICFGWQFAMKAVKQLPAYVVKYYVGALAADPEALHASAEPGSGRRRYHEARGLRCAEPRHAEVGECACAV